MNATAQTRGRYEQDPMPFVALMAIAAAAFVSLPALVLGIALAPLARRARIAFALLALAGLAWVASAWGHVSLEMHRAHLVGARAGMFCTREPRSTPRGLTSATGKRKPRHCASPSRSGSSLSGDGRLRNYASATNAAPTAPAAAPNAARGASSASASSRAPRPSSSSASTSEEAKCSPASAAAS